MGILLFTGGSPAPSLIFPYTLPGIQFDYIRYYMPSTGVQTALSGKQSTIAYRAYPLVHWEYSFEFLRDNVNTEVQQLVGLLNAVQGRAGTFLHTDPDFNAVSAQPFGTGDGSTLQFQLVATYNPSGASAPELVQNFNGSPSIYINGTLQSSGYSVDGQGIVHFSTPPSSGAALTWSGQFYYRCRFDEDHFEFKKFMNHLWKVEVKFTSVTL